MLTSAKEATAGARWALPALFAGAAAIGFAPIFVRLSPLGPNATAFYRLALALPVLWAWHALERRRAGPPVAGLAPRQRWGLVAAGLFFAGDLCVWHAALGLTAVANATLLPNVAPVFVTLTGYWLFGERVSRRFLAGMAVALAGAGVLMGRSVSLSMSQLGGDALALATAVLYAGYIVAVGRLRSGLSTASIMARSGTVSCLALLAVTLATGEDLLPASAHGWGVLAALALLSHASGQSLIAYALAHLPASFSAVALLVQPAVAAALAWAILAEPLGAWQALGAAIILAGIALAKRASSG